MLFLVSMGKTGLSHDIFFEFSLRPFEVVEVEWKSASKFWGCDPEIWYLIISESLAANLEKVSQTSVWQTVPKFSFIWHFYCSSMSNKSELFQKLQFSNPPLHRIECLMDFNWIRSTSESPKKLAFRASSTFKRIIGVSYTEIGAE